MSTTLKDDRLFCHVKVRSLVVVTGGDPCPTRSPDHMSGLDWTEKVEKVDNVGHEAEGENHDHYSLAF